MTNAELIARLSELSPDRRVKCLQVGMGDEDNRIFHVVNIHEDLAGVQLIIDQWTGERLDDDV